MAMQTVQMALMRKAVTHTLHALLKFAQNKCSVVMMEIASETVGAAMGKMIAKMDLMKKDVQHVHLTNSSVVMPLCVFHKAKDAMVRETVQMERMSH